ncbi:MAG: minor capsid protein [Gordonibacter sp.]|uniref:minor capsid protein n=1 Tax=Gordonibacter sp. TaxID=1968902 RepID=UPI002FCC9294
MSQPKITVDLKAIEAAYSPAALRKRQAAFAQRVGFDMRKHVPEDEGTLRDSMDVASDYENGQIIWDTPYAKRVYNADNVRTVKNVNAAPQWGEVAKAEKVDSWRTMAGKLCGIDGAGSMTIGEAE